MNYYLVYLHYYKHYFIQIFKINILLVIVNLK